jgi:hypothetical protein
VNVVCGIDKSANTNDDFQVVKVDDAFPEVDAIVITTIAEYSEVRIMLKKKYSGNIYSLEDIVLSLNS